MINNIIIKHLNEYYTNSETKDAIVTKLLLDLYSHSEHLGNKMVTMIESELMIRYNLTNGGFQNAL
jgi:hypothetical protein